MRAKRQHSTGEASSTWILIGELFTKIDAWLKPSDSHFIRLAETWAPLVAGQSYNQPDRESPDFSGRVTETRNGDPLGDSEQVG